MAKVLIVDDEVKARSILQHHITSLLPEVDEIRTAGSIDEARTILKNFTPDLVFLDIEMPYQDGFELLRAESKPHFNVIFTTAYNQHAIQALRFSAVDYLLKPIEPDELVAAFKRFKTRLSQQNEKKTADKPAHHTERRVGREFRLAVPSNDGIFFFSLDEIMRLEADRNYTIIHLRDQKRFIASKTLKHFEDILGPFKFIRCHKSHLVNPDFIIRISNNNEHIVLSDGSTVQVSRRKKDEVRKLLNIS